MPTLKEELALLSSKGTFTWGPWCLGPVNVSTSAKLELDPGGKMYTLNYTSCELCRRRTTILCEHLMNSHPHRRVSGWRNPFVWQFP